MKMTQEGLDDRVDRLLSECVQVRHAKRVITSPPSPLPAPLKLPSLAHPPPPPTSNNTRRTADCYYTEACVTSRTLYVEEVKDAIMHEMRTRPHTVNDPDKLSSWLSSQRILIHPGNNWALSNFLLCELVREGRLRS